MLHFLFNINALHTDTFSGQTLIRKAFLFTLMASLIMTTFSLTRIVSGNENTPYAQNSRKQYLILN